MSVKRTEIEETKDRMCRNCMLFYGAQAYQGLCSSCHKYIISYSENVKIRKRKKQQPKLYNLRKPLLLPVEKIQQIPSNKSYSNLPKKIERDVSTVTKKWDFQEYNANVALYTATRIGCPKTTNVFSITQKWVSKNFKNRSLRSIMVKLPKFDSFSFLYIIFYFLLPKFTTLLFTNIHYYSFLFHILQAAQTLLMATSETFELVTLR